MPNSSGHPTLEEVKRWSNEQKPQSNYEYVMPWDTEKVKSSFKKLGMLDCMKMCGYSNISLDKKEIEEKAKYACKSASHASKAIDFTNYYDKFEEVAKDAYTEAYSASQELFSRKYHVLRACKQDYEWYGEESFFARIASDLEQVIRSRK
jgi:hypothetical protein